MLCLSPARTDRRQMSKSAAAAGFFANLVTLTLDLATFQTPLAILFLKKSLVTNQTSAS
uniref:Uncharacterized protein n=1 Tax=Anguilla anguilla TaxID=7936 RepID=A0A0E9PUP9_ANGAN